MRIGRAIALGFGLVIGGVCLAQPAPTTQPASSVDSIVSPMQFLPAIGSSANEPLQPEVYPTYSPDGDTSTVPPSTEPANNLREGMYLSHRGGRFSHGTGSVTWQFTPDADPAVPDAAGSICLAVLPNRQLSAMEDSLRQQPTTDASRRFAITGVITNYNGDDYLLVTGAAIPNADSAVLAAEKTEPATQPSGPLSPDRMLDQMLQQNPGPNSARTIRPTTARSTDRTSGAAAVAPGAMTMNVLREGTFLVDRTGRLTRAADGQTWEFSFDSDGRAMKDAPVVILPNLKLMSMEQAAKSSNRDLRFRITGMVTEYNGRNYVLLEKVVVVPEVTQQF
jgi:hypothetical protein